MKIRILEKTEGCIPEIIEKGDWIDLCLAEDVTLKAPSANKLHRLNRNKKEFGSTGN